MTFSRCPNYNGLPPQCQLVTDVNKPCCKKPYCNFQGVTIEVTNTPAPNMGTTIAPNPLNPTGPTLFPTPAPPGLPSLFLNLANMSVTSFLCFLPFSVTIDKTYNMLVFHLALSPLAVEFQDFAWCFYAIFQRCVSTMESSLNKEPLGKMDALWTVSVKMERLVSTDVTKGIFFLLSWHAW